MFFVLNKIDVFRVDNNWERLEKCFIDKIIKSIKIELSD